MGLLKGTILTTMEFSKDLSSHGFRLRFRLQSSHPVDVQGGKTVYMLASRTNIDAQTKLQRAFVMK